MSLEHHRDLAREFPELKHRIHELKQESPEFRQLLENYQTLDNVSLRIEQEIETPSDDYTEQLQHRRARLKDHLYGLLTGRLQPTPRNLWCATDFACPLAMTIRRINQGFPK